MFHNRRLIKSIISPLASECSKLKYLRVEIGLAQSFQITDILIFSLITFIHVYIRTWRQIQKKNRLWCWNEQLQLLLCKRTKKQKYMYRQALQNVSLHGKKTHTVISAARIAPFLFTSVSQSLCVNFFSVLPLRQPSNLANLSFTDVVWVWISAYFQAPWGLRGNQIHL